jgi:hypothetical protein
MGLVAVDARPAVADPKLSQEHQTIMLLTEGGGRVCVPFGCGMDCADLAASLAVQPVGLAAVEAQLAVADPALFREYQVGNMAFIHHLRCYKPPRLNTLSTK